jgi:hypothetical protein
VSSGICPSCGALRRLGQDGVLVHHHYSIKVSVRAVKVVGAGKARRPCPGSGRPPRRVEG